MDYNRVLKTLNDLSPEQFIERVSEYYDIAELEPGAPPSPEDYGQVNMYINKRWHACRIKQEYNIDDPADGLDCAMLSKYVFLNILGIENIRKDK